MTKVEKIVAFLFFSLTCHMQAAVEYKQKQFTCCVLATE